MKKEIEKKYFDLLISNNKRTKELKLSETEWKKYRDYLHQRIENKKKQKEFDLEAYQGKTNYIMCGGHDRIKWL